MVILVVVLSVLVCLTACRTVQVGDYEKKDLIRPSKLVETVMSETPDYRMASYKFSAEYAMNGGTPDNFSGILRVSRDSLIWISLRSFNIEGFRLLISPDSVKVMNRIQNQYYIEGVSALEHLIRVDLTYRELQAILLNEFFYYPMPEDTTRAAYNYKSCVDTTYYCISSVSQKKIERSADKMDRPNYSMRNGTSVQTVRIIPGSLKIKNMYLEDIETARNAYVEYDNFVKCGNLLFPQTLRLEVEANGFVGTMKFNITDFEVSEDLSFPFKIPAKYTKVNLNE